MDDAGKGVHRLAVDQHVEFDHVRLDIADVFVVHRAEAAGQALDAVVEVDQDFVEGEQAGEHDPSGVQRLGVVEDAALFRHQGHQVADVFVRAEDKSFDGRLLDLGDVSLLGQEGRVVDFLDGTVAEREPIDHAGVGGDDVHVVFAAQAFLDNLQVEQTEKTAAKAKAQGNRSLRLVDERRVVQLEFGHVGLEMLVIGGVDRVNAAEHHRMNLLKSRQRRGNDPRVGDGVAHLDVFRTFDVGGDVAGFTHFELLARVRFGIEAADFLDFDGPTGMEQLDLHAGFQPAVEDPDVSDDALVGIEVGVEAEGLQGRGAGPGPLNGCR